jgi:hypothetical protein
MDLLKYPPHPPHPPHDLNNIINSVETIKNGRCIHHRYPPQSAEKKGDFLGGFFECTELMRVVLPPYDFFE